MDMHAHMSGQISGQLPNQGSSQLSGLSQHNGGSLPNQIQNMGGRSTTTMDPEEVKVRRAMLEKIYQLVTQRHHSNQELQSKKVIDIVKRLEEGLYRNATTKEDYMNMETLESRLHALIKRPPLSNHNQQYSHAVNSSSSSSSSVGMMIPTPVMPQSSNPNMMVTPSMDSSLIGSNGGNVIGSSVVNNGNVLSSGPLSNVYQQSTSKFSMNPGGNMLQSTSVQRMSSQMIPTPGFNNNNNQSSVKMDSPNGAGGFSNAEPTMMSQSVQQKHVGGQNSRILHNLGSHFGGGGMISVPLKSYGFPNGALAGGFGTVGNNMHLANASGSSEGYSNATPYGSLPKPLQQHYDQTQRTMMLGDGNGVDVAHSSGSTSLYGSMSNDASMMNNHNLNPATLPPVSMTSQSNLQTLQQSAKNNSIEQSEKMTFHSRQTIHDNILQSQQQQQFQQQLNQLQQQQFIPHQQQRQQKQQQILLRSDSFGQSHLASNVGSQLKPESGLGFVDDILQPRGSNQFQHFDMQSQLQHGLSEDYARGSQFLSLPSASQDICSSMGQTALQMQQVLQPQQLVVNSQNDFSALSNGLQSDVLLPGQWQSRSEEGSLIPNNLSQEQNVQEEFRRRIIGQGEAQRNYIASEGNQSLATRTVDPPNSVKATCQAGNLNRDRDFKNQQKWLLFLRHARGCKAPEGKCLEVHCIVGQKLCRHMALCNISQCTFPRCFMTKKLIDHNKQCRDPACPVCIPVRKFLEMHLKARAHPGMNSEMQHSVGGPLKFSSGGNTTTNPLLKPSQHFVDASEDRQPSIKRIKAEQATQMLNSEGESFVASGPFHGDSHAKQGLDHSTGDICMLVKPDLSRVKIEIPAKAGQVSLALNETVKDIMMEDMFCPKPIGDPVTINSPVQPAEEENIQCEKEVDQPKKENVSLPTEDTVATKSGKPKIKAVSLMELFTPEQVREHIRGLRRWVGQSKAKAEKNQALGHSMSENSCQLCAIERLTFEPPPMYCTPCGARIKRNAMYYIGAGDTRHFFCTACYNESRGDTIVADGMTIPKSKMEKKKNDEETEEWWVQCDYCEAWQHQICGLFNGRRNDGGQAEYTCPRCYIKEVERGERLPLPESAVLGAKDLPRTILSDHIEQRLFKRLKHERMERAKFQGKSYDEVPGAEALVVRVVSSVDKKLEVKPRFLEIFGEENYPTEFPYKSKVVLLFQKIEGVEVCLFGMYVQEFGSECDQPNHRRVYLSYLDSVKYFRPEVRAVTGEALRTFVYHEILIGYLEYCKKRGFTSCYIWACPPLKGEDYILYCHPEIQKTPKSDKLREWYLSMLKKAMKENIVVELTNLYEHFFVTTGECKARVTASRLPYFDGDYWPGAAEDMIYQIRQEEDGKKLHKKGITKKIITKRALKASGQTDLSSNASKDLILMHKLGETISPMKEDFIMVHLQHSCSHCCILMVDGNRWVCNQCKKFQICDECYEAEQKREDRERHPIHHRDKHILQPIEITDVTEDTTDKDENLESEFFDTRQAFLSLCQGNHYQYDTLRRAKHSSMMALYHLHNPTAPAFVTTCNVCSLDIEAGQGWRCEVCPEYDVCNACYLKGGINHAHKLTNNPSMADRDAQSTEAREQRVLQLRKMLELLVHASQCRSLHCQYPNCRKVKGLFRHGIQCKVRAGGGCLLCKRMWYLLQLHARACKVSECHVPRCRDLRAHFKRSQQQSDSRRRAAVMEMMRQRKAEVDGSS
ncbi:histone acetyltransferase HAC1-like [Impatiens glandulifera]|uniref:histone acetyltransferase HAC1-like n=1 Tax=Impatiens glandulifera TaxID=253017 RepID=UPI001FB0CE16|nr:histone acetyltransferase HAC1-like [Impatiens glandulifera]XP_047316065.1 histone acetyltransferase HAC1-like [Impatiens glandulifera]